jgi:hypothetical protein
MTIVKLSDVQFQTEEGRQAFERLNHELGGLKINLYNAKSGKPGDYSVLLGVNLEGSDGRTLQSVGTANGATAEHALHEIIENIRRVCLDEGRKLVVDAGDGDRGRREFLVQEDKDTGALRFNLTKGKIRTDKEVAEMHVDYGRQYLAELELELTKMERKVHYQRERVRAMEAQARDGTYQEVPFDFAIMM